MVRKHSRIKLDSSWNKLIYTVLPQSQAQGYIARLNHWIQHKGPEWTAQRLKALWSVALLYRSGEHDSIRQVLTDARIAQSGGMPVGIEKQLVLAFSNTQTPSKLRRASLIFRTYQGIKLLNASQSQVDKAKKAITSPGINITLKMLFRDPLWISERVVNAIGYPELDTLGALHGTAKYPGELKLPSKRLEETPYLSLVASLLTRGRVPTSLVEKLGDFSMRRIAESIQDLNEVYYKGKIVALQEGGAKARVIAQPNAWIQYYCYPYHRSLMRGIFEIENLIDPSSSLTYGCSCVFDQNRGLYAALQALESGRTCYSVDLSSATDRFPLSLQIELLDYVGLPEYGEALLELSHPWQGLDNTEWAYAAGQPMGLYGSFPLFHLTHYLLLSNITREVGLQPGHWHFAVLGDDVVIFDKTLREAYLGVMDKLRVPINSAKSLGGNTLEFAGFVITKSRDRWFAFRPYKGGEKLSSVLNVLHSLGHSVTQWGEYWNKAYAAYQSTLGMRNLDLTPLIPSDEDLHRASPVGTRYIGALFNEALYYLDVPTIFSGECMYTAWGNERYELLKENITGLQTQSMHDTNVTFDPKDYIRRDTESRKWLITRAFSSDPLIADYFDKQLRLG